ncbi:MAG: YfhO family protein [Pirellulales bacterium]|nr:YfhO family protein [Pirellulales bacterium]
MQTSEQQTTRETNAERRLFDVVLVACALLLVALALPFVRGEVYTHDDLGAMHLPLRAFYATCLAQGDAFDWLPHLYGGVYLTGEGQTGSYHPFHLLLYRWLPFAAAFDLELISSYVWMLVGSYLFLARRLRQRAAALFGALLFTFSGFNLLHLAHMNGVAVVAHLPWLLWTTDWLLTAQKGWRVVAAESATVLLFASQLLLGYPQYVWFNTLALVAFAGYLAYLGEVRRGAWRWWAIALGLGVLAGGVQLLPSFDALEHAARREASPEYAHWGSLAPVNVVQLVAPYLTRTRVVGQNTHELGLYAGAVTFLLALWLAVSSRCRPVARLFGRAALGLACVALILAMGQYGLVYELQTMLPLVGSFRFPCRAIVLVHFALAVAAAVAFAELWRLADRREEIPRREQVAIWSGTALSLLAILYAWLAWDHVYLASLPLMLAGPTLFFFAGVAISLLLRRGRLGAHLLVWLAALDVGVYGLSYSVWPHAATLSDYVAAQATPPGKAGDRFAGDLARYHEVTLRLGDQALLAGWQRIDGYLGLEPARELDYRQLPALRLANVRWVARSDAAEQITGLTRHDAQWFELANPLPRVRCVSQAIVDRHPRSAVNGVALDRTAVVEEPLELESGTPGRAALVAERPGQLDLSVEAPGRQLLVIAESFHRGWQATIDERPAPVLRTNGDFMGVVVPAGRHEVALRFRPPSLRGGVALSLLGLMLAGGLYAGRMMWVRRSGETDRRISRDEIAR